MNEQVFELEDDLERAEAELVDAKLTQAAVTLTWESVCVDGVGDSEREAAVNFALDEADACVRHCKSEVDYYEDQLGFAREGVDAYVARSTMYDY